MFKIEYHRHGTMMKTFNAPQFLEFPCGRTIEEQMDSRLHTAIYRNRWGQHPIMHDVLVKDLLGSKGKVIGTLFATKTH